MDAETTVLQPPRLDAIVEVVTTDEHRGANILLSKGYMLLAVGAQAHWETSPCGRQYGIAKRPCFILGRTSDIEHCPLPAPKKRREKNPQQPQQAAAAQDPKPDPAPPAANGNDSTSGNGPLAKYRAKAK